MIATLAVGSLFASGIPSQAQENTNAPAAGAPPGGMRVRPNFDTLAKNLELTDAQKPQVKVIFDEQQQKMKALRADTSVAQSDKRAKAKEIRDAASEKLKTILTPEQYAKWEKNGDGYASTSDGGSCRWRYGSEKLKLKNQSGTAKSRPAFCFKNLARKSGFGRSRHRRRLYFHFDVKIA